MPDDEPLARKRQSHRLGLWARVVLVPVAGIGAILSFRSLYEAAIPTFGEYLAAGFPLLVDLLILGASLQYVAGAKVGRPMTGWRLTAHAGVAATLILNALAAPRPGDIPWHVTAPAVWAVLVELTAKQVLGEWRASHAVRVDKISLPLWVTAPLESMRTRLLMFRTGTTDAHQARISVGLHAAAREALRLALPARRSRPARSGRRVRRVINRQLRAGSLPPAAILRPLGWTEDGVVLSDTRPEAILHGVLYGVLAPTLAPARTPTRGLAAVEPAAVEPDAVPTAAVPTAVETMTATEPAPAAPAAARVIDLTHTPATAYLNHLEPQPRGETVPDLAATRLIEAPGSRIGPPNQQPTESRPPIENRLPTEGRPPTEIRPPAPPVLAGPVLGGAVAGGQVAGGPASGGPASAGPASAGPAPEGPAQSGETSVPLFSDSTPPSLVEEIRRPGPSKAEDQQQRLTQAGQIVQRRNGITGPELQVELAKAGWRVSSRTATRILADVRRDLAEDRHVRLSAVRN